MSAAEWKKRCEAEWGLRGAPFPDRPDWKSIYEAKPLARNLLRNPAPLEPSEQLLKLQQKRVEASDSNRASLEQEARSEPGQNRVFQGLSKASPPPENDLPNAPPHGPPRFQPDGDFTGWTTSTEVLPYDTSGIPEGVVVCALPQFSWFTLEQVVDLKAEGLWEELLDDFQPEIVVQDCYEESQLHQSIYQLQVKLLAADKSTVISEHSVSPTEDLSVYSHQWKEVSHVFSGYGPGVRYIHFLHRLKNSFLNGFFPTRFTDSSVVLQAVRSAS